MLRLIVSKFMKEMMENKKGNSLGCYRNKYVHTYIYVHIHFWRWAQRKEKEIPLLTYSATHLHHDDKIICIVVVEILRHQSERIREKENYAKLI